MQLSGTITAMATPFDENGTLDTPTTARLAAWLAGKGIDGLFIGGTTGEGLLLTLEERERLTETVVGSAGDRVKVLVQAGCATTADTIRIAKHAMKAGADGAALLSPFFYGTDKLAMIEHFATVAGSVPDFPIYLYNIPGNTRNPITLEIVETVVKRCSNVAGIKDSSKDLVFLQKLVEMAPDGFSVLVGSDSVLLPGLAAGAIGGVSAASTAFPEAAVAVVDSFFKGDLQAARAAQQRLNTLLKMLKIGPTPAGYKAALKLRGIPAGGVRPPLRDFTKEERERFEKAFNEGWKSGAQEE